eukprot:jgi/Psemu1/198296/e_gw1.217.70.1
MEVPENLDAEISSSSSSSSTAATRNWKTKVFAGFTSLRNSPSELYKVYALKFLDSYSYFSFSIVFTLFLSDDFGYSDIEAGAIYGAWGAMITVYGFCTGFLVDNIGVSKSLRLGYGLSLLGRLGIFATTSRKMLLFHIYLTMPLGSCLGIPVLSTGIRRYTHEKNRGFAFGLFYVVMNIAALVSGPAVDMLTIWYKGGESEAGGETYGAENEAGGGWSLSSYRAIILSGMIANVIACCITFTVREIKVEDPAKVKATTSNCRYENSVDANNNDENNRRLSSNGNGVATFRPKTGTPWKIIAEIWKSPSFRRYLVVVFITLNVRQIFRHMDGTWPKYMIREFGPDVPKGTIYSINPAIIILLVPIISATTANIDPLVMIHVGTYVSAASVFFLVASTSIWSSCLFVFVLSLGEAIWSPRLYDYTVSVSEEGREGTYMALSSAPLFLAKLPVGILSGFLLQRYCPENLEEGEVRHSRTMWLIIGSMTATSPLLMTCCWRYVSKKDRRSNDEFGDGVAYTELQTVRVDSPRESL